MITETLRKATRDFAIDVEIEAAKLIKRGVPPFDAVDQARNIVSERRRSHSCGGDEHG